MDFVRWLLSLFVAWFLAHQPAAVAQLPLSGLRNPTSAATTDRDVPGEADVARKRADVAQRLAEVRRVLSSAQETGNSNGGPKPPERLEREEELLKQSAVVLSQQESASKQKEELDATRAEVRGKLELLRSQGPSEQPPYSFLLLDQLRDELASEKARETTLAARLAAATDALTQAREVHDQKEKARRQAKEALETNKDDAAKGPLESALMLADLESQLAAEVATLRKIELDAEKTAQQIQQDQVALRKEKVALIAEHVEFSDGDLQLQLLDLDNAEEEATNQLELAQRDLDYHDDLLQDARRKLDLATDTQPALVEEVEAWRVAREKRLARRNLLSGQLKRLGEKRTAWNRRYDVAAGNTTPDELDTWQHETAQAIDQLERDAQLTLMRIGEKRGDIVTLENRAQAAKDQPEEVGHWIGEQRRYLQETIQLYESDLVLLQNSQRLHDKLHAEIRAETEVVSLGEWLATLWRLAGQAWNYQIIVSEDDRPITVGKILTGIVLLLMGYVLSRSCSRLIGQRLLPRLGMHASAASALQAIAFYLLLMTFTLMALRLVNVPITLFTFLGGALAIGLGFGSQNLMNNFISGLILLAERPIRVGDLINVEGLYGTVEQIGARSTRVRTGDNVEIIIPNSTFLQNNVVNWTLSDNRIRTRVLVGVAYGSPTRDVARLLERSATEHGLVLKSPPPFVWFTEFGDNSLLFEVHFWVQMRTISERLRVESDVRHRIDHLFRDAGITIAFPQRDVHFDTKDPLRIHLVQDEAEAAPALPKKALAG